MKNSFLIVLLFLSYTMNAAIACTVPTPTMNQMAIITPCSPSLVTWNQKTPGLSYVTISDQDMLIAPSSKTPIQVAAPGMVNVEVWTHGKFATRLVSDGVGGFSGVLSTVNEKIGPLTVAIYAWNAAPGTGDTFTVGLSATMDLFVNSGSWLLKPQPAAAVGMKLKWAEYFHKPSFTPCKPGTGVWPNCAHPTAADGFTWYENKPGGGDFGDAAFEHTDGPYNPYFIIPGYLRIRSTYDPAYVDPYGFKRHWRSGLLATAFPDGTSNLPVLGNGYYEARILLPSGSGASWNTSQSGGTWPAFWTLDKDAITDSTIGNVEWDIGEWYSVDMRVWHTGVHSYAPATGPNAGIFGGSPTTPSGIDLSWDFHRYGLLVTDTTVTAYFDDVPKGTLAKSMLPGGKPINIFLMLNLAMGSGWPDHAPPAGYYDMWIKYVWYWAP